MIRECYDRFAEPEDYRILKAYRSRDNRLTFDERFSINKSIERAYAPLFEQLRADAPSLTESDLFYNEEANLGISSSMPEFMIRISNNCNKASLWISDNNGLSWKEVYTDVDVSGFHHNNYKGFFALRPAVLTAGSAVMTSFDYRPID